MMMYYEWRINALCSVAADAGKTDADIDGTGMCNLYSIRTFIILTDSLVISKFSILVNGAKTRTNARAAPLWRIQARRTGRPPPSPN